MMSYNILEQRLIFHTFGIDYPQCLAIYHNYFSFYFLLIKKKKKIDHVKTLLGPYPAP